MLFRWRGYSSQIVRILMQRPKSLKMRYYFTFLLLLSTTFAAPTLLDERQATCPALPSTISFTSTTLLPDPFLTVSGTRVTTQDQWGCRQQEISALMQKYELGTKPPKPSSVTQTLTSNSITVTCSNGGTAISFTASITYPSTGTAPYPAIIANGGMSIPTPTGVAIITFNNDDMALENDSTSRGQGKFYTLYGSSASAGALTAWAWGVSRLIDALEATTSTNKIDVTRLGVTGCSRNGKGAFVIGALDNRIILTIPQESGSGGAACWRVSDQQKAAGANIQTASEIVGENVWFSTSFNQYVSNTAVLPYDHHMLAGLVQPRGLFVIENDIDWLGPVSTTACMEVGQLIYKAAGTPDAMGFSLVGGHAHCAFPSAQQTQLNDFIDKYLMKGSSSTAGIQTTNQNINLASYYSWTVPTLSNVSSSSPTSSTTGQSSTSTSVATTVTTSTPSTTTSSQAATSTASGSCTGGVALYGQCGGLYYLGGTTCACGSTCHYENTWYSQCLSP